MSHFTIITATSRLQGRVFVSCTERGADKYMNVENPTNKKKGTSLMGQAPRESRGADQEARPCSKGEKALVLSLRLEGTRAA